MTIGYPENVIKIMGIMSKHGYRAYAVGGCVRDVIMGREPSDWDMTTNASPEKMMEIFASEGVKTVPTGLKHGTVTVLLGGEAYEVTTFRIDGSYTDSRHPDEVVFTSNIEDDLARRDFTVNAMAAAPVAGTPAVGEHAVGEPAASKPAASKPAASGAIETFNDDVIDVFGGIEDINNKIIRAVGDPERRFTEDALRILRVVRFAAILGFEIEENTKKAAAKLASGLKRVSIERKIAELKKILVSSGADKGIDLIFELGLCEYIHEDIKRPSFSLLALPARFETRMAALFFENESVLELSSLKLSRAEAQGIKRLCDKDAFCGEVSDRNARRMIFEYGELAADAAMLHQNPELASLIGEWAKNSPCVTVAALKVSGNDLMSEGIEPRRIGGIMSYLLDRVIDEPELNERGALIALAKSFRG